MHLLCHLHRLRDANDSHRRKHATTASANAIVIVVVVLCSLTV